jgi:hypothetical protein
MAESVRDFSHAVNTHITDHLRRQLVAAGVPCPEFSRQARQT